MSGPYAAFLALEGSRCVVVGGGEVAERKTRTLLASGAAVVVVAPRVIEALAGLAAEGAVTLKGRRYRPDDLDGARLELESWLTDERAELLGVLAAVRCNLQATGQSPGPEAWRQAVDAEVVRAIQSGDPEAARRRLVATLQAALLNERAVRS